MFIFTENKNNPTEHSPPWDATRHSDSQEIPRILWNPEVHCRVQNKNPPPPPPLVSVLNQIHPILTPSHPTSLRSVLIISSHLRLRFLNSLFLSGFPTKILYFPCFVCCYMARAHLIFWWWWLLLFYYFIVVIDNSEKTLTANRTQNTTTDTSHKTYYKTLITKMEMCKWKWINTKICYNFKQNSSLWWWWWWWWW
jgi:hypothetical protein